MNRRRRSRSSRCARCGKTFAREEDVLNHMNQPWSKCASWMHDLVKISDTVNLSPLGNRNKSPHPHRISPSGTPANDDFDMNIFETTDVHPSPTSSTSTDTTQSCTEMFPGAGRTYGTGQTFMNIFDADQCAHYGTYNLYYPFASKDEWQLASWLLQSNLSMQAIDEFLHLDLVSLIYLII